jgi:NlpC/P60 family putative phage cell wall peptidase
MITREEVVAAARSWIGTPFREQQSMRGEGADCVGLGVGVGRDLGHEISVEPWKQSPDNRRMERECDSRLRKVPVAQMQPGDVVLIQTVKEPHHMGILSNYRDGFGIIHALKARGKVVEHRLDSRWHKSIVAAYRYPSVA